MSNKKDITPTDEDWCYTDSKGRRIGWMWPEDFKIALDSIWGKRKGIQNFARYAGLHRTTVEFYCNGKSPVPKHLALLVNALIMLVPRWDHGHGATPEAREKRFPKLEADWLGELNEKNRPKGLARRPFP